MSYSIIYDIIATLLSIWCVVVLIKKNNVVVEKQKGEGNRPPPTKHRSSSLDVVLWRKHYFDQYFTTILSSKE